MRRYLKVLSLDGEDGLRMLKTEKSPKRKMSQHEDSNCCLDVRM